jgi:hypothetical protein
MSTLLPLRARTFLSKGVKVSNECETLYAVDVAKLVRVALKKAFPRIKFSVRCRHFSSRSTIEVEWTGGPAWSLVNAVIKQYCGEDIDPLTDIWFDIEHWLLPDGSTRVRACPLDRVIVPDPPVPEARRVRFFHVTIFAQRNSTDSELEQEALREAATQASEQKLAHLIRAAFPEAHPRISCYHEVKTVGRFRTYLMLLDPAEPLPRVRLRTALGIPRGKISLEELARMLGISNELRQCELEVEISGNISILVASTVLELASVDVLTIVETVTEMQNLSREVYNMRPPGLFV